MSIQSFTAQTPEQQELTRLLAENAALKAANEAAKAKEIPKRFSNPTYAELGNGVSIAVGEKNGLSIYGLGGTKKFPVNMHRVQFQQLLSIASVIQAWMEQPQIKSRLDQAKMNIVK